MKLPLIRVSYAWLIDPVYREAFLTTPSNRHRRYPTPASIRRRVAVYRRHWKARESKILVGICRAAGVRFAENIIHAHVVGRAPRSVSYPLVISAKHSPDEFVDVLTHELIHHVLVENTSGNDLFPIARRHAPAEDRRTAVHVLVHAILQFVYLDVLGAPDRLKRDRAWARRHQAYHRAWEIVERQGYQSILRDLRKSARRSKARKRRRG